MDMRCGYCGYYGEMVFVHSHYQCPRCKTNIAPCCEGEFLPDEDKSPEGNGEKQPPAEPLLEKDEEIEDPG